MTPFDEDFHVHSTFSDGRGSVMANVARAVSLGLRELGCVDHVRSDTGWLPAFVSEVRRIRAHTEMTLHVGVEAKLLDERGALDLPPALDGVDLVYAADHRIPIGDAAHAPRDVRAWLDDGRLRPTDVAEALVSAALGCLERYDRVVLAHLFSALPKVRLTEAVVPAAHLHVLAATAAERGAMVEIDERWRSPSPRVIRIFLDHGVRVVMSTDAHKPADIGRYAYARWALARAREAEPPADGRGEFRRLHVAA